MRARRSPISAATRRWRKSSFAPRKPRTHHRCRKPRRRMDQALIKLLTLNARGTLRRILRGMRTVRGAFFSLAGAALVVLWLGPSLWSAHWVQRSDAETVRSVAPLIMLMMALMNLIGSRSEKAVHFSPSEVDLLFAGPFSRRELIGYKIALSAFGVSISALLMSAVLLHHATLWIAAYVGLHLGMMFI